MIPGPYAVCIISFDNPDSDAATYRVVQYGYDTAEQAFRHVVRLKKTRAYKKDLVVIQHMERDVS